MARHLLLVIIVAGLAGCGKPAADDGRVLGVKMGDPVSSLNDAELLEEPPLFNVSFRPKDADPVFRDYSALVAPAAGVCAVRAKGVLSSPDRLHDVLEPLRKKYGKDTFRPDVQGYYWYPSEGEPSSSIQVVAVNYFGSNVSLVYTFTNIAACRRELEPKVLP